MGSPFTLFLGALFKGVGAPFFRVLGAISHSSFWGGDFFPPAEEGPKGALYMWAFWGLSRESFGPPVWRGPLYSAMRASIKEGG